MKSFRRPEFNDDLFEQTKKIPYKFTPWQKGLEVHLMKEKKLSGRDWRVLMACINLTYGFRRNKAKISPKQLYAMTEIQKNHVSTSLKKLDRCGYIIRTRNEVRMVHFEYYQNSELDNSKPWDEEFPGGTTYLESGVPMTLEEENTALERLWPGITSEENPIIGIFPTSDPHFGLGDIIEIEGENPMLNILLSIRRELGSSDLLLD